MPLIKYVGKKEIQKDVLYDSFVVWNGNGDIQSVSSELEPRLLQHPDCYVKATEEELVELLEKRAAAIDEPEQSDVESESKTPEGDESGETEDEQEENSRINQIADAIDALDIQDESLWGKSTGKPHVKAVEDVLGYDITAEERDAALELIDSKEAE